MPINWVDVPDPRNPPAGAPALSAVNLAKLAVTADIGTTGTPTGDAVASAVTAIAGGASQPFNVKNYGAKGNNTTDDTAAIQAAVDAATSAGGGTVYLPAGTFYVTSPINVTASDVVIRGAGRGVTKVRHNITAASSAKLAVFTFLGSIPAFASPTTTLTANTKIPGPGTTFDQSRALSVTSSAAFAAGDVVMLGDSNTVYTWTTNAGWGQRYRGEMARVESVGTGLVTLMTAVRDAYATATTAALWKPTLLSAVGLHDLTIYSDNAAGTYAGGACFDLCRNVNISGVAIRNLGSYGIKVQRTYGTQITGAVIDDLLDNAAQLGYGVILEGTEQTVIANSTFRRCRHGVSTGGIQLHVGWTRNTQVIGCDAIECTNTGFDTHAWTTDLTFSGCRSERNVNGGFASRGERVHILNCSTSFNSSAAVYVMQQQAKRNVIRGLASHNDLYGVQVVSDADGTPDELTIAECSFIDTRYNGVFFNSRANNAKVLRNNFVNVGAAGMAVDVRNAVSVGSGSGMAGLLFQDNVGSGLNSLLIVPSSTETGFVAVGNRLLSSVGTAPAAVKLAGGATLASDPAGILVGPATGGTTGQVLARAADGSLSWADQTAGATVTDATTAAKGIVQLAGDLAGTAAAPTVAKINGATPATVATTGAYTDLTGRPALATVATSGSYADLSNQPTIPAAPALYASGTYYHALSPSSSSTSAALGNNTMRATPVFIGRSTSLVRLGAEVATIGDVGSKVRLGIYADNGSSYPGALVVDAGQIAGDSATMQELTISQTLAAGLYWFAAVVQSATTTQPTLRTAASGYQTAVPLPLGTALPGGNVNPSALSTTNVSGALPGTYPAGAVASGTGMARLFFKTA